MLSVGTRIRICIALAWWLWIGVPILVGYGVYWLLTR
jgi:hypothetical protein